MNGTLNNKIEMAWMAVREQQPAPGTPGRREFQTRFIHVLADELGTTIERVRQRVAKIERREMNGAPHCSTCTCAEVTA